MPGHSNATTPSRAAPVFSHKAFRYDAVLGLTVNGIPRCDKTRLLEHLAFVDPGPALTKKGKPRVRQPPRPKDESVDFYRAQMVHYGLASEMPLTVSLEDAKLALGASTLQVLKQTQALGRLFKDLHEGSLTLDRELKTEAATKKRRQREAADELGSANSENQPNPKRVKKNISNIRDATGPVDLDAVSGTYRIAAQVPAHLVYTHEHEEGTCEAVFLLELALSPKRSHVWGSFEFSSFSGTLRSTGALDNADGIIRFHWTGIQEALRGWSRDDNSAFVQFLPGGKVEGEIDGGPCEEWGNAITFSGQRVSPAIQPEDVRDLKVDYWRLYMENYEGGWEGRGTGSGRMPFGMRSWQYNSDSEQDESEDENGDNGSY